MIVTGEVGLHVVLFEDRQDVLDNFWLVAMGQPGRIGWMMAEDQFPFRLGSGERAIEPFKLRVGILSGNITELRIVLVLLHKRTGIEEKTLQLQGRCHLMDLRVIPGWNNPSRDPVTIQLRILQRLQVRLGSVWAQLETALLSMGFEVLLESKCWPTGLLPAAFEFILIKALEVSDTEPHLNQTKGTSYERLRERFPTDIPVLSESRGKGRT
jgi:hypothetical protein